jgi:hypothetical protein
VPKVATLFCRFGDGSVPLATLITRYVSVLRVMSRTKNLLTLNSSRINNSSGILHLENAEPSRRENRQFSPVESYTHVKVTGFWLFFTLVTNHHQKSTGTGNESFHGTQFAALCTCHPYLPTLCLLKVWPEAFLLTPLKMRWHFASR